MGRKSKGLPPRKTGKMPDTEKLAIAMIHQLNPEASARQIAQILGRRESAISQYIAHAAQILQVHAPWYASQHVRATEVAAANGDARPAQWALERLCAADETTGAEVRVVERETQVSTGQGLTVNIALPVGNIPGAHTPARALPLLPIEVVSLPVSDSRDET